MVSRKIVFAVAATAATVFGVGSSQAANVLKSGDTVGGWKITFPTGIALTDDGGANLTLEKTAAFTSLEGLVITFNQVSYSASDKITITDESITNVSGQPFGGFQFLLLNTLAGNAANAAFDPGKAFNDTTPPFTTQSQDSLGDAITLSGGVIPDTGTAKWGYGADGGQLDINAHPATSGLKKVLDFKEIPLAFIPLPAAAWSGLTGLVGLGVVGSAKRLRKLLA
jgi:hypothetical protein